MASDPCGVSFGEFTISDLDFADDVVLLAEILSTLVGSLEALSRAAEPLGLKVSWAKTKIQAFDEVLQGVESVAVCSENVEIVNRFTYLGSVIHSDGGSDLDVERRLGMAYTAMESLNNSVWRCRNLSRRIKVRVFETLVLPVLFYGAETWTLVSRTSARINSFLTKSLRRILGYRWDDFVSNHRVLQEANLRLGTCMIRERQMRLFGHVARFPAADPVHGVLSSRVPPEWRRPRGRPRRTWLRQMESYCQELGFGREQAWELARNDPGGWRARVDAAKRCLGVCSHT